MSAHGSSEMKREEPFSVDHVESEATQQVTKARERKLLRKVDLYVLPWISLTYALSLIDRTNIAAAKISGMEKDLNLTGNKYSIALLIFFIPYILTEIPSNAILRRIGPRTYLTIMVFCWGIVAMCFGFVKNFGQLAALRVLLGIFEGGFQPATIYVITCWYKRHEVQQRLAIWFVSGSVISGFTGILSYGLSQMEGQGGLRGWRWIFIIPGLVTVVATVPVWLFVSDFPEKARWLKPEESQLLRDRLSRDSGEDISAEVDTKQGLKEALKDWKVYVLGSMLLFPTAGAYSFAFFTPSILSSFGFNVALSQILTTPPYIFSAIVSIGTGMIADRVKLRSPFIVGYSTLVCIGLVLVGWGPNTGAKLCGIFLAVTGNNCAIPTVLAFMSNNMATTRKRQFAVPVQTVCGGIGGIVGSLVFRAQDYPGYRPGLYATFACMAVNSVIAGCLALYFWRQNKKADKEGVVLEGVPGFRYTL